MTTILLAAALAAGGVGNVVSAQEPGPAPGPSAQGSVLDLSCIEALAAVGEADLAGVFSFIPEKDLPAAFADLVVNDGKALKKYVAKVGRDFDDAGGITTWDRSALLAVLALYSGPAAPTLEKPSPKVMARINELSLAATMSLEQVAARRKK
ncbi:MAG: hypothetical protein PHU21_11260 [Elusimicrobia bacterium]|nr:hypothetical protein [Elusimicrobiota bacterium]